MMRFGIVMAGGSGERFWPLSTPDRPKQLLDLTGSGKTLLQQAFDRLEPLVEELYVSTSTILASSIAASGLISREHILAEPAKRNTAGALCWSMAQLEARHGGPFLAAITTADHAIGPDEAFHETVRRAFELAEEREVLTTIGIPPTRPDTGYGYIEQDEGNLVKRFTEKPDLETAKRFVESGTYLWNSGMFFWRSDVFERELKRASPEHRAVYDQLVEAFRNDDEEQAIEAFQQLPDLSIDYALMERSQSVGCIPATFGWDDVGTWDSLLRTVPLDIFGNAVVGKVRVIESSGCVAYNASERPVTLLKSRDQILIVTDEATLMAPLSASQEVRLAARQAT